MVRTKGLEQRTEGATPTGRWIFFCVFRSRRRRNDVSSASGSEQRDSFPSLSHYFIGILSLTHARTFFVFVFAGIVYLYFWGGLFF